MQRKGLFLATLLVVLAGVVLLSGCGAAGGPQATPVPPTKTPKPTFTPTTVSVPTRLIIPTATSPSTPIPARAPASPTPEAAEVPPTATPQQAAQFTANQGMNVRMGPGTNYPTIGQLKTGDNFKVMAKNQDASWLQFNYEGDPGWVSAGLVTLAGDVEAVKVAQNIPPAPTPRPVVVQQPAPAPAPAQPAPAPAPAQPACSYKYCVAKNIQCRPQAGGTWFDGKVTKNGQPVDGERVVWSGGGVDGAWATDPVITGPHPGYPGWDHGYFSHLVSVSHPRKGDWSVWVVDAQGKRISEAITWHSDGQVPEGTGCNDNTIRFEG